MQRGIESGSRGAEGQKLLCSAWLQLPPGSWRCLHLRQAAAKGAREQPPESTGRGLENQRQGLL